MEMMGLDEGGRKSASTTSSPVERIGPVTSTTKKRVSGKDLSQGENQYSILDETQIFLSILTEILRGQTCPTPSIFPPILRLCGCVVLQVLIEFTFLGR